MGKDKKKHSKKDQASEDILDVAALSLKKFRKVTKEISKLSTGQKVAGSIALAAAGLVYLAVRDNDESPAAAEAKDSAGSTDADGPAPNRKSAGTRNHRKGPKSQSE